MNFRLKKSVIFVMIFALIASMFGAMSFAQSNDIRIIVDGQEVESDVAPQLVNGRTLVPIRVVSDALGANVRWDQKERVVYINSADDLSVGAKSEIQLVINDKVVATDVAPQLINNRTMVPIRVVSDNLDADVKWDQASRTVTITSLVEDGVKIVRDVENPDRYPGVPFYDDELLIHVINYKPWELEGAVDRDIGDALKAAFPDLKININIWGEPTRDDDLVAAGVHPDIVITTTHNNVYRYLKKHDWHFDMTEMIENSSIDLDKLNYGAVEMLKSRSNGGIYGVPIFIREYVMFHNKIALDALGAEPPQNGVTWDEFYEDMKNDVYKGSGGARMFRGLEVQRTQYLMLNQLGLSPFTNTGTWTPNLRQMKDSVNIDTPEWLHLVENLYRFMILPGNAFNSPDSFFRDGNVSFVIDNIDKLYEYSGIEGYYKEADKHWYDDWVSRTELGVTAVPVFAEKPNQIMQPNLLSAFITRQSDKKEDAMRVIEWLAGEEGQLELSKNGLKAVLETEEIVNSFAANIPEVAHIEGLAEAVYWGENAPVLDYEYTDFFHNVPIRSVFDQNIRDLGYTPEQAIQRFMYDKSISNGLGLHRYYEWDDQVLYDMGLLTEEEFYERNPDRTLEK